MPGPAARTCSQCGAAPTAEAARHCSYCGAELPPLPVAPTPGSPASTEQRFAALQQHADLARLMALAPTAKGHGCGLIGGVVFMVVFVSMALFIFGSAQAMGAPSIFGIIPLIMAGVGVFMGLKFIRMAVRFHNAPLQREPALVCGKRTEVSGGGQNSSARTTYHLTLEFPGGARQEYQAAGPTIGKTSEGDVGVAYLKGDYLVDFELLRV